MDEASLYKFYKIQVESLNDDDTFNSNGNIFQLIWLKKDNFDELYERYKMAVHMHNKGIPNILVPLKNDSNDIRTWHEGNVYVLLMKTNRTQELEVGKLLADFHLKGRSFLDVSNETNRFGNWMELWERRLEQVETLWQEKCFNRPQNDFEKLFVGCFPYYLGLAENALSYLNDLENGAQHRNIDFATICFGKFTPEKLLFGKNPFDWVYDHPMRDVAEYIRSSFFENPLTYVGETKRFLKDYFGELPITTKSAKLLVARLLLPLNFFETVETYFTARSDQVRNSMLEKLEREVKLSSSYQKLIMDIFDIASIPEIYKAVRIPEWIVKVK